MARPVIVCTEYRGVFFGYAEKTDGDEIALKDAKMALYWDAVVRGVLGLACVGPVGESKVSAPADITVRKVTAVLEVTPEAEAAWRRK